MNCPSSLFGGLLRLYLNFLKKQKNKNNNFFLLFFFGFFLVGLIHSPSSWSSHSHMLLISIISFFLCGFWKKSFSSEVKQKLNIHSYTKLWNDQLIFGYSLKVSFQNWHTHRSLVAETSEIALFLDIYRYQIIFLKIG